MKNSIDFLIEIRKRLLLVIGLWALVATFFAFFSNDIYHVFALPLLHQLNHQKMIATAVMTPLFVPLQSALVLSVYICIPFFLYQVGQFIRPALYQSEQKIIRVFMVCGSLLFYAGSLFAYTIALPLLFRFLTHTVPPGVTLMPDMGAYFAFVVRMLLVFGLAFEVPIILVVIVKLGIVKVQTLTDKRPYIIVGSFVVGMLLTPPDVISQIMLALPLWGLFEVGVLFAKKVKKSQYEPLST